MTASETLDSHETAERALRFAAVLGAIGLVGAVIWGFYVFAGIAISGYVLGRNRSVDALAVLPPLGLCAVLLAAALVALRGFRRGDALTRVLLGALVVIEGTLGVSLGWYAVWAGSRVARVHVARAGVPQSTSEVERRRVTIVAPPPRAAGAAARAVAEDGFSAQLTLAYACRGDWTNARMIALATGDPMPEGENVCLTGVDLRPPCPACEQPFKPYERGDNDTPAHRRWLERVAQRFSGPHRLRVQITPRAGSAAQPTSPNDSIWLYGYRVVYAPDQDVTTRTPPRRLRLTVRSIARVPTAGENLERWLEVAHYTDAVYGLVVAPHSLAAMDRVRALGIPSPTHGQRACHDTAAGAPTHAPTSRWEIVMPPRLCLCCTQ